MRHLKTHSGEKSNKCNQCDYASYWAGDLKTHRKMHNGENSNKCNQCDYVSFQAGNLRTHLKTHSGEKLNKCNQCDFAYDLIYQSNLPSLPTYLTFLPDQPTCFQLRQSGAFVNCDITSSMPHTNLCKCRLC